MKIVDVADITFRELGEPTDISIASIVYWLKNNFGNLNVLLTTDYDLDTTGVLIDGSGDELGIQEANIYSQLYKCHRARTLVRNALGAAGTEVITSINSDGASISKVNKTTIAAEYRKLALDEDALLKKLCDNYNWNKAIPDQVAGDDTIPANMYPYPWYSNSWPRMR